MSYDSEVKRKLSRHREKAYAQIECEIHPHSTIVLGKRQNLEQAIFELKFPKDKNLTPLTNAQIEQDLYNLGLLDT